MKFPAAGNMTVKVCPLNLGGVVTQVEPSKVAGSVEKPRTPLHNKWAWLVRFEKGQGMNLVRFEGPRNAVTGVNPDFSWKKRQRLKSLVGALRPTVAVHCACVMCGMTRKNESNNQRKTSKAFDIANPLLDPLLELHDSNGATLTTNDNWKDTQQTEIEATGLPPTDDNESAILQTLAPGAYTAILRGVNDTTGVGLVEVYNLANTL